MVGPVVLDLVQHFTERWNEVKKRKYKNDTYAIEISVVCHSR